MLSATAVSHRYGARAVLAVDDFTLAPGEHCVLLGASGSGKTTLLHILAGLLPPAAGRVTLDGDDLYAPPRGDAWRARRIGLVPQKLHLIEALTALDNLQLAQSLAGTDDPQAIERALTALALGEHRMRRPSRLSAGQQQRVAIARAVVNRPRLLLADEPTSALDDLHAERSIDLLVAAARACDALLVVATHDARIRGRFARVIELGTPGRG